MDIKDDNASAKKEGKSSDISTQKTFNFSNATSERCRQIIISCERGDVRVKKGTKAVAVVVPLQRVITCTI